MRTRISIDDDVLAAAKTLAEPQQRSLGKVISDLARRGLRMPGPAGYRNGVPLLASKSGSNVVTPELVALLSDEMP
jgi:hypothetical protein